MHVFIVGRGFRFRFVSFRFVSFRFVSFPVPAFITCHIDGKMLSVTKYRIQILTV